MLFERRHSDYAARVLTCRSDHSTFAGRTGDLAVADDGTVFAPFRSRIDVYAEGAPREALFELQSADAVATGVALRGSRLSVADASANAVYVYARAAGGWSAAPPVLSCDLAPGFAALGSIALR